MVARRSLGGGREERRVERAAEPLGGGLSSAGTSRALSRSAASSCARSTAANARPRCRTAATRPRAPHRAPPKLAVGMAIGSMSSSRTCLAMLSGSRNPPTNRSRSASAVDGDGGSPTTPLDVRSSGGSSGASRSKSRYWSDICTPPSPSVIVWCIFWISAALPPRSPSTTTNCHSGRVRSNGSMTRSVARSSSWRIVPGLGRAIRRTCWSISKSGSSTHSGADRFTGAGWTRQPRRGTAATARSIRARR